MKTIQEGIEVLNALKPGNYICWNRWFDKFLFEKKRTPIESSCLFNVIGSTDDFNEDEFLYFFGLLHNIKCIDDLI